MKLQKIVNRLQKLHPKEIDLSLGRIQNICKKLNNPQDKIKAIAVVGTNGKQSTINAMFSILKQAKIKCNVYTSPHLQRINERFIFNNKVLGDDELSDLFEKIDQVNGNNPLTFFEALTAVFFYKAAQYPENINLIESGLFFRFDATNILKKNLASIVTPISEDHLDWLPKNEKTIKRIVFEKTSSLLESNIVVSKQNSKDTLNYIKETISENSSKKFFFNEDFSFLTKEDSFFYYKDKFGNLKLPLPNILGNFQLENISTAIATLRLLDLNIKNEHIKKGITKIQNTARLQEIKSGKLKELVKNNRLLLDGSHNADSSRVLNEYLQTLNCRKHIIIGMMANKNHEKYISYFKNISSLTTIDIPGQPNSISGKKLKEKFKNVPNVKYKKNLIEAIKSVSLEKNDLLIITGSLYLSGEFLNIN
tara:strand:+ start:2895 stop:4160 length:1266 start_codon:yes stop_codon:yes gene_type:complete